MLRTAMAVCGATAALALLPVPAEADNREGYADVTEKALPSVVNVSTTRALRGSPYQSDPFFRDRFRRRPRQKYASSLGSGVIVSAEGYILTNNHVVAGANGIKVSLSDGREFKAKLVGADPKSDLAVLKLVKKPKDLKPIRIGKSADLRLGDVVLAIGNPFGVGQTVTMGIVSATGRADVGIVDYEDFIQTDAAINPGNSGGALINTDGELVGINTAILSRSGGYQGIGFAIPTDMAAPIMKSLVARGRVIRGWLGVEIQTLTREIADALGVNFVPGVVVAHVVPDGPAGKAGLKRHDVILRFNGKRVKKLARLRNAIASAGAGRAVEVEYLRGDQRRTTSVRLTEQPGARQVASAGQSTAKGGFGAAVTPLNKTARRRYKVPKSIASGVVVTQVAPKSIAASLGVRPGDVIVEVNRSSVQSAKQFRSAYAGAGRQVALLIYRDGSTVYLAFTK